MMHDPNAPRKRGRPWGSKLWRERQARLQAEEEEANNEPKPGSIEYARAARAEKHALKLKEGSVSVLGMAASQSALVETLGDPGCMNKVGSNLQHDVLKTVASGMFRESSSGTSTTDEIMQFQLSGTLHTMSFRALAKIAKKKVSPMLGRGQYQSPNVFWKSFTMFGIW